MARTYSVLIADTDPQGLESLVQGFKGCDWNVTVCPITETIPLLLKASGAQIVVLASRDQHDKAVALFDQLQGTKGNERLCCLLLAPEHARSLITQTPTRGFLPMPAFVADVLCASEILVAAQTLSTTNGGEESTIELPIPARGALSFVRTLCALGRSGSVTIEHGGKRGEILFVDGEITSAQFGPWQGAPGAHHMLTWDSGLIRLQLRTVARRGQLGQSASQFVEEADRFRRDFEHELKTIGPRNTVFSKTESQGGKPHADIPTEVMPVLRLCDGHRTLSELLNESPFRLMDTVRIIARLLDLGALTRRAQAVSPKNTTTSQDSFWETARISQAAPTASSNDTPIVLNAPRPEPPAALPEVDQRSTIQPRRKDRRRIGNQTLTIGAPANITAQSELEVPKTASSSGDLAMPVPRDPITSTPETGARTSGTIEMGTLDRRSRTNLPAVKDRPSIVIDIQDGEARPSSARTSPGVGEPTVINPPSPTTAVPPAGDDSVTPLLVPLDPGPPAAAGTNSASIPASSVPPIGRITGVLDVVNTTRTSRITGTRAVVGSSIQLDSSLTSAESPVPASPPTTSLSKATPTLGARITGVMQTAPSAATPTKPGHGNERVSTSFQIDPSLSGEGTPAMDASAKSRPRHSTPVQGSAVLKPSTSKNPAPSAPAPITNELAERKSRISGAFDAVESDFFAREADLYKDEGVESFKDLDDKHKGSGKGKPQNKRSRK